MTSALLASAGGASVGRGPAPILVDAVTAAPLLLDRVLVGVNLPLLLSPDDFAAAATAAAVIASGDASSVW